jgi:hypothetical protein
MLPKSQGRDSDRGDPATIALPTRPLTATIEPNDVAPDPFILRVAHYPPNCSKYNPIEHRFFPHVTRACQGLLLTSTEVTSQAMAHASTKQGLKTTVHVLAGDYPLKEGYPEEYLKTM